MYYRTFSQQTVLMLITYQYYGEDYVPLGTISGPKYLLVHINDLSTPSSIYKYYMVDCTIFEIFQHGCSTSPLQESADVAINLLLDNNMRQNADKF